MHLIRPALGVAALGGALALAMGCGAKSGLRDGDADVDAGDAGDAGDSGPVDAALDTPAPCVSDLDCLGADLCLRFVCSEGICVPGQPVFCDDGDECTADQCDPASGECVFEPLTRDEDDDGYFGPRPGFEAGEPGSCGDDCDDTSAAAHPGGQEICDGVDNDCNGIVDDNMRYEPSGEAPVRVSTSADLHGFSGGIAFDGNNYGVSFAGQRPTWTNLFKVIAPDGSTVVEAKQLPRVGTDTWGVGPVVWTGSAFATVWEHPTVEDSGYEIYFNRLDTEANKLGPDVQVSKGIDFSLSPDLLWNGSEFLVFWEDHRNAGSPSVYAQRIAADASPLGGNAQITSSVFEDKVPVIAEGTRRIGVAFLDDPTVRRRIGFRTVSPDLADISETVVVSENGARGPAIAFSGDRFVVVWETYDGAPGDAIWGSVLDETGNVLVSARRITASSPFAQSKAILPLGDRILLIWGDYRPGNYELYTKMLGQDLRELTGPRRITFDGADTLSPSAAFGPDGDVGVLFDDKRSGTKQPYFTRLVCTAGN